LRLTPEGRTPSGRRPLSASLPPAARPAALRALICLILLGGACGDDELSGAARRGEALAAEKGCVNCHSADGSRSVGPTWRGLAGSQVKLSDGSTVRAGDAYLKESIQLPSAKTVEGFPAGLMESVIKPGSITDRQAAELIAYIKTLE
jgi:cytochrome c553